MKVPSITGVFVAAYLYENEIRDLFGVEIERIAVDWLGKVYEPAEGKAFSNDEPSPRSAAKEGPR